MAFEVKEQCEWARTGKLTLAHGEVQTPAFMPVGTLGTVKTLSCEEIRETGSQIILGNTYHLFLRPGLEVLRHFGGLHRFMDWNGPILTDSGGFQVFSLAKLRHIDDDGVEFRSHIDGDLIHLTPKLSAEIQQVIGSDIAMVLDECPALPADEKKIDQAVNRSYLWAQKFLEVPRKSGQKIFGIVQGGTSRDLRLKSLELTASLPLDGIAIGGLSVGEPHDAMVAVLEGLAPKLPQELPHYLMGVGTPLDILEAVHCGVDMFDCVLPTRNGRNGGFFTDEGLINIRNASFRLDERPISEDTHPALRNLSRSYLRHLFSAKEILGCRLATLHNLYYYHRLLGRIRSAIASGTFPSLYAEMKPKFVAAYKKSALPDEGVLS